LEAHDASEQRCSKQQAKLTLLQEAVDAVEREYKVKMSSMAGRLAFASTTIDELRTSVALQQRRIGELESRLARADNQLEFAQSMSAVARDAVAAQGNDTLARSFAANGATTSGGGGVSGGLPTVDPTSVPFAFSSHGAALSLDDLGTGGGIGGVMYHPRSAVHTHTHSNSPLRRSHAANAIAYGHAANVNGYGGNTAPSLDARVGDARDKIAAHLSSSRQRLRALGQSSQTRLDASQGRLADLQHEMSEAKRAVLTRLQSLGVDTANADFNAYLSASSGTNTTTTGVTDVTSETYTGTDSTSFSHSLTSSTPAPSSTPTY
jgi:hypothetical protein